MDTSYIILIIASILHAPKVYSCPEITIISPYEKYIDDIYCTPSNSTSIKIFEDCEESPTYILQLEDDATFTDACDGKIFILDQKFGISRVGDADTQSDDYLNCFDLIKDKEGNKYTVLFKFIDVNEFAPLPVDVNLVDIFNVSENVDGTIKTFQYMDLDATEIDTLRFNASSNTPFELIDLGVNEETKTRSYEIHSIEELDYETKYSYKYDVTFTSSDARGNSSSTIQTFFIQLLDQADMPPIFIQYIPYASFEEGDYSQNPIEIYRLQAIDGDFGINNGIRYSITGGNELDLFTIDEISGDVSCNKLVDREILESQLFFLEIEAKEVDQNGNPVDGPCCSSQNTSVNILDVNDNIPTFDKTEYVATTDEHDSSQNGDKIIDNLVVLVQDFDEGAAGTFYLTTDSEFVRANPESGNGNKSFQIIIQPSDMFDFDLIDNPQITIKLTATEKDDPSHISTANLKITLEDLNDNSPVFGNASYVQSIAEGTAVGSSILTVNATDGDVTTQFGTESIVYSLRQCGDLDIDPKSGDITIADEFDYESKSIIECDVIAEDMEGQSGSQVGGSVVTINVVDINDESPQISNMQNGATVKEDDINYVVSNVSVYDPDTTADISVKLVWDDDQPDEVKEWFELHEITQDPPDRNNYRGEIRIMNELQRELNGQIIYDVTMKVVAEDLNKEKPGTQNVTKSLIVTITDVNDESPYFDDTSNCDLSLLEEQEVGALVCIAVAYDDDLNDNITYTISDSTYLSIDKRTGEIRVNSNIDRDTPNNVETFDLTIIATDIVGHSTDADVTITVLDANDNSPLIDSRCDTTLINITEGANDDDPVVTVTASDKDKGIHSDLIFKIQNDYDRPPFYMNATTGDIVIDTSDGRVLDREKIAQWDLFISVNDQCDTIDEDSDCEPLLDQCTLHVIIQDENDNDPRKTELSCNGESCSEIPTNEMLTQGSEIEDVELTSFDPDEPGVNSQLIFRLSNMTNSDGIELDDFLFAAVNDDRFNSITNLTEFFCKLKATQDLTGLKGNYEITIETCDGGQRCTITDHPLKIQDSNDQKPIFSFSTCLDESNKTITMLEGESELRVPLPCQPDENNTAEFYLDDADEGDNARVDVEIDYGNSQLLQGGDGSSEDGQLNSFRVTSIDSNRTFAIEITQAIDRELGSRYKLSLVATDNGSPELSDVSWIYVIVQDVSEYDPYFENTSQLLLIKENEVSAITFVEAIDPDNEGQDENDKENIFYTITGGFDMDLFEIRNNTIAEVYPKEALDRETKENYTVQILAYNGQLPSDPDETQVLEATIMAEDVNDVKPYYYDDITAGNVIYGDFLQNGNKDDLVATFQFADDDLNDQLSYQIVSGFVWSNGQSYTDSFRLNAIEGNLCQILINMNPSGTDGYCTFNIQATDQVGHTGSAEVKAFVVTSEYLESFIFLNEVEEVKAQEDISQAILSDMFGYTCIIDSIAQTVDSSNTPLERQTTLKAHFIRQVGTKRSTKGRTKEDKNIKTQMEIISRKRREGVKFSEEKKDIRRRRISKVRKSADDEPVELELVPKDEIEDIASDGNFSVQLTYQFSIIDLNLMSIGDIDTSVSDTQHKTIVTYKILFGTTTLVLALALLMIGLSYFVRIRKLNLEIKSLTTNTFGSKGSGLDKIGSRSGAIPGSNFFATEGSNPLWTTMELDHQTNIHYKIDGNSESSEDSAIIHPDEYSQFKKNSITPADENVNGFGGVPPDILNVSHLERGRENLSFLSDSSSKSDDSSNIFKDGNFSTVNPLMNSGFYSHDFPDRPMYEESSTSNKSEVI